MTNSIKVISFVRAVSGVCSGTAIFPQLVQGSFFRTLWHLVLLSILLAAVVTIGRGYLFGRNLPACGKALYQEFGEVSIGAAYGNIHPEREPDKTRSVILPWDPPLEVVYVANFDDQIPEITAPLGIIFTPKQFYWYRVDGISTISLFQMGALKNMLNAIPIENLATVLKEHDNAEYMLQFSSPIRINPDDQIILHSIQYTFYMITYIGSFLGMVVLALVSVGIFTLIFGLSSKLRGVSQSVFAVKPREIMIAGIYAGMPPMLIGTLFSALDLPFLEYNTIYMFGMACYLMFAVARIQFSRLPMPPNPGV